MITDYKGVKVAVVGMGKTNVSLARYLAGKGALVTCFDKKGKDELGSVFSDLSRLSGVSWNLGEKYLEGLPGFGYIFLTPGMKKNLPEIKKAQERGSFISMEIPLLLELLKAKVAGVTGSAGKTTTVTLTGGMLRESLPQKSVYVGGNIGSVLIEKADAIPKDALVVLELSSFQLEMVEKSPNVSALLNLQPNHLDVHDSYEEYVSAKKKIVLHQSAGDFCVLNLDDEVSRDMAKGCVSSPAFFSLDSEKALLARKKYGASVAFLKEGSLFVAGDASSMPGLDGYPSPTLLAKRGNLLVPGLHNVANVLAASLVTLLMGGDPRGIRKTLERFQGVAHRIEFIKKVGGINFYNDSIATSPDRTGALLDAISGDLIVILGGYDKGIPFDFLARKLVGRVQGVVLMGDTAGAIEKAIGKVCEKGSGIEILKAKTLEEATLSAFSLAEKTLLRRQKEGVSSPKCSVALSPACASYDMFENFEERGKAFKKLVRDLR